MNENKLLKATALFAIPIALSLVLGLLNIPYLAELVTGLVIVYLVLYYKESASGGSAQITAACQQLRETGDVSQLAQVSEGTGSAQLVAILKELLGVLQEIGGVMEAHAQNNLKSRFKSSYTGFLKHFGHIVNNSSSNLEFTLVRISRIATQIESMVGTLSSSSSELAEGSVSQASALEEISSTVQEVSSETSKIDSKSEEGYAITEKILGQTRNAEQSMVTMTESMEEVKESSKRISAIIKVIDDIAFQTNLLALNAAVEAARAGQHGKGFAVVADEVRNLANRSAKAAKETETLIGESLGHINRQADVTESTSAVFHEISENINELSEIMKNVNTATTSQAVSMNEISSALSEVDNVVQGNTAIAEESNSMALELTSDINSLNRLLSSFSLFGITWDKSSLAVRSGSSITITDSEALLQQSSLPGYPLEWKPEYLIGVDEMDYHHKRLVDFINMLYSSLKRNDSSSIVDAVNNLLDYTIYHFKAEEAVLDNIGYPDLANHIPRHNQFIAKIEEVSEQMQKTKSIGGFGIVAFLTEWLLKHILHEDRKYADFIADNGLSIY